MTKYESLCINALPLFSGTYYIYEKQYVNALLYYILRAVTLFLGAYYLYFSRTDILIGNVFTTLHFAIYIFLLINISLKEKKGNSLDGMWKRILLSYFILPLGVFGKRVLFIAAGLVSIMMYMFVLSYRGTGKYFPIFFSFYFLVVLVIVLFERYKNPTLLNRKVLLKVFLFLVLVFMSLFTKYIGMNYIIKSTWGIVVVPSVGDSMYPYIQEGDNAMTISYKKEQKKNIKRFDVVTIHKPLFKNISFKNKGKRVINIPGEKVEMGKRVVGLPGEKVEIRNSGLYINGKKINNKTAEKIFSKNVQNNTLPTIFGGENNPITLNDNEYFVIGDNLENSLDSRYFGVIEEEQITARYDRIIWPPERAKVFE